jgi:uncharacterized lipoprotein
MKQIIASCLSLLLITGLTACGTIHNRTQQYKQATTTPPLTMPEGTALSGETYYPIPKTKQTFQDVTLYPPGLKEEVQAQQQREAAWKKAHPSHHFWSS